MKHDYENELFRLDDLMEQFVRRDVVGLAVRASEQAVDEFNTWLSGREAILDAMRVEVDEDRGQLDRLTAELGERDRALKASRASNDSVERYNQLVMERNLRVHDHEAFVKVAKARVRDYNEAMRELNREAKERGAQADAIQAKAREDIARYHRWIHECGINAIGRDLNQLYASLHETNRAGGVFTGLAEPMGRARRMRRELADHAREIQRDAEHGVLLVSTLLCGAEECLMLVDTGASIVSITPEIVEVLGLGGAMGDKIEISLPGGIRIMAPQLRLPQISVQGMVAEDVAAVVLPGSLAGVDGCLGLSFLNCFRFFIEKERPQSLRLEPSSKEAQRVSFDVFISHKSEDLAFAREVYDALVAVGHRPFLSDRCLANVGKTEFQKVIDSALEEARHLVVVGSSRGNIESPWVEAEWRMFVGLKRRGRKQGNVISVLCGHATMDDLPLALGYFQSMSIHDANWRAILCNFLPGH